MLFEFSPSYVYYLSVCVILLILSFVKRKREVTPWRYIDLLYLFVFLVSLFCVNLYFKRNNITNPLWYIFFFQLLYIAPLLYIFFIMAKRRLKDIYFIIHNKEDILWGLGIGMIIGVLGFFEILINKEAVLASREFYIGGGLLSFYIILPIVNIIGPLTEELIFRGILIPTLEEKMKTGYALILSVLIFCLMHGSFYRLIILVFMGFILGVLFVKRRTIIPGFIVHSMLNSSYFIAILLILTMKI
jgi:membrane protease YdiL (CAAX protease family)